MGEMNIENRPVALRISGVKKMYKLGQIGGGSLQADLQSWWAKKRGKEDPNSKIGQEQRLVGQTFMALNGIDMTAYQGEAIGIIGGNGAGKSTLLKLISQVTAPTAGKIELFGRVASMLEVGTGFNGEMTGRENVYMNGAILGMTKAEIDAKMEDIIEFSEVRDFIDTPVKRYSSGMYVKLAFSVAAHLDSEIMIMDEVLAVGDMAFQKKCLNKMREVAKNEERTVLYVSHNMNTIRQLCDRCFVLDKGKIVFQGETEEAIAVYMQTNIDNRLFYEYSDSYRSMKVKKSIEFLDLRICGKEINQFSSDEPLEFEIHMKANADVAQIKLRFECFCMDGTVIGTAFSRDALSVNKNTEFILRMKMTLKYFAPGRYKAVALAYEYDQFGSQIPVDRVEPAFCFVVNSKWESDLVWLHQYWGHVRFDDIITTDMEYIS